MFRLIQKVIKKIVNSKRNLEYIMDEPEPPLDPVLVAPVISISAFDDALSEPVAALSEPVAALSEPVAALSEPVAALADDYKYTAEMDVINKWKRADKNDIVPLIAMIRQLYFFSDCRKTIIRTYSLCKEDIPHYIRKISRRPELQIDVSDVDVNDHPLMFNLYRRLRCMVGMHRTNGFMVRIEHAFDNSQIQSEHFMVSRIMKIANKSDMVMGTGIDDVHHVVVPMQVHLKSISKIPSNVRTMFHHISYSIQPIVHHSQTLDTWFKTTILSHTHAQIMQLCIQMAKAVAHLHEHNIVHGDIKPGNTLIKTNYVESSSSSSSDDSDDDDDDPVLDPPQSPSLSLYLIDFGMSGSPGNSDGTGGTKPFCAPETGNGFNSKIEMDTYNWTKLQKHHDVWSFSLVFFTLIVLRKSTAYPKDYPFDFFETTGHVNPSYFDRIPDEPTRDLFRRALCPAEDRITAAEFLTVASRIRCNGGGSGGGGGVAVLTDDIGVGITDSPG